MSHLVDLFLSLPPALVLVLAFALPAAEASVFLGVLVPGETAVVVAGVLANAGRLPLWAVIAAAAAGAVVGDQIGFAVGRRYGQTLLDRLPGWVSRRGHPEQVLALIRRRGVLAVLLGRWTASLRAFVPGIAGMSGLAHRRFTVANVAGGVIWAVVVATVGYLAGAGFRRVEAQLNQVSAIVLASLAGVVLVVIMIRHFRGSRRTATPATPATDKDPAP